MNLLIYLEPKVPKNHTENFHFLSFQGVKEKEEKILKMGSITTKYLVTSYLEIPFMTMEIIMLS